MTKEQIIQMVREAGARAQQNKNCDVEYLFSVEQIERLLAAENEANAELLIKLKEARDLVNDWGECASLEERDRYGLAVDLQMLDAAIAKHSKEQE